MIADFINDKMTRYIAGGMSSQSAAHFTCGELLAIYKGEHHSRDSTGAWQRTPPPEPMTLEAATYKCNIAINEIIKKHAQSARVIFNTDTKEIVTAPENQRLVLQGSAAIKHTIAAGVGIKFFFINSKDNDSTTYTTDYNEIAAMWSQGQRRFKAFIRGRFLAVDIDRKPGKTDGLETFYRIFPKETLPATLRNLPVSFPCYVQTPTGGYHLYFKYEGPEMKLRELAPGVEIKEWQITCPGSRRENGDYPLHGELSAAPPLYGLLIDAIEETKRRKEREKAERLKPRTRAAADRPMQFNKPRITLDDLANEAVKAYSGNHDRQVSFAGRAYRCKFSGAETLAYVKSRSDIFGNDKDTDNTIRSVFRDNGGCL
jgi:hypothetical protein